MRLPREGHAFDLSCPYCGRGWTVFSGFEVERIIQSHECPSPFEGTGVGAA